MEGFSSRAAKMIMVVQLLFTATTAGFGFFVNVQQQAIKQALDNLAVEQAEIRNEQERLATGNKQLQLHIDTAGETTKFVEITQRFLAELTIEKKQKEAILIDLLDAIALATVSETGKADKAKLEHMPLSIALATQNVEALGLIGVASERRDAWYELARRSGDPRVQMTAMEALALSSARDPTDHLRKIFELSERLNNDKTLEHALAQVNRVVRVMAHDSDPGRYREDKGLAELVMRLDALRTSLAPSAGVFAEDSGQRGAAQQKAEALAREGAMVSTALEFLKGGSETAGEESSAVARPGALPSAQVASLINDLKSTNIDTRRQSRTLLANADGDGLVEQLLDGLAAAPGDYRVRIGVATAIYKRSQPLRIGNATKAETLVRLVADEDVLVRKYASEALMKMTDPPSVRMVHEKLSALIANRSQSSANGVYNSVVILGTWLRILPSSLSAEKDTTKAELVRLRGELVREQSWGKTLLLIDEMLRASEPRSNLRVAKRSAA